MSVDLGGCRIVKKNTMAGLTKTINQFDHVPNQLSRYNLFEEEGIVDMFACIEEDTMTLSFFFFFCQAEDGIRDRDVTGVQTCALPISAGARDDRRAPAVRDPAVNCSAWER